MQRDTLSDQDFLPDEHKCDQHTTEETCFLFLAHPLVHIPSCNGNPPKALLCGGLCNAGNRVICWPRTTLPFIHRMLEFGINQRKAHA